MYYGLALAITPKVSGSLSIIGSILIIRDVVKHWRSSSGHNYHQISATSRVLLSMSIADLGSSFFAHFLSTWMVPTSDDVNIALAGGNETTCTIQAFTYELFFYAAIWSYALLAVTYWLTICRQKNEDTLRNWKYQLLLIGIPWIIGLISAIPKVILGQASYNGYWWCELSEGRRVDNIPDQISVVICFILVVFSLCSLIRFVYLREKKMDQFTFTSDQIVNREKTIQVTYQGLFYISVYLLIAAVSIPITIDSLELSNGYVIFWSVLFPLQGFGNFLVYFRPKYVRIRQMSERNSGTGRGGRVASVLHTVGISTRNMNSSKEKTSLERQAKQSDDDENNESIKESFPENP